MELPQVAITSGIPYSAIRGYGAGRAGPTPERLRTLADALQLPTTELAPPRKRVTLPEPRWHTGLTVVQVERAGYSLSHTRPVPSGVSPITETSRWSAAPETEEEAARQAWDGARAEHVDHAERSRGGAE